MARVGASGTGGATTSIGNIDGGSADAVYLLPQILDGGGA